MLLWYAIFAMLARDRARGDRAKGGGDENKREGKREGG